MSVELALVIVFVLLLIFLFIGMYISSGLLLAGIVGLILLQGPGYMTGFLQSDPFIRTASYSLSTIPLFVLMAQFIVKSGVVEDLFNLVYNYSKGKTSVLGTLTVVAGGLMGAVSGSSNASAGAMGQVAVPQLLKRGYSEGLAGATVASAGSLSSVIPPSIILILWGVATETPISQLFIGAVFPGIIIALIIIMIMLFILNKESKNQKIEISEYKKEEVPLKRTLVSLISTGTIVLVVFFGIYAGLFTPTEAGAVGAFVSFVLALILGKVNFKFLISSFSETVKLTAMIMMIMIAAQIFGRFVSLSHLPRTIIDALSVLIEFPILIIIILSVIYFVLFMFIEGAAVIIMTAPFVYPLIQEIGTDPLWFGVLVSILCTIGLLTPPLGLSVYSVSGVTGIPIERIFRYSLPFAAIITVIIVAVLVIFPGTATYLPSRM